MNGNLAGRKKGGVVVRSGSKAGVQYQTLPHEANDQELAGGFKPSPGQNLIYRGGRVIPNLRYQNIFLGGQNAWKVEDIRNINESLIAAMSDPGLNNVVRQYFGGQDITTLFLGHQILPGHPPKRVSQRTVRALLLRLYHQGFFAGFDFKNTAINFLLPKDCVLSDPSGSKETIKPNVAIPAEETESSLEGLGGYHGSVRYDRGTSHPEFLYYAVGVYSAKNERGENGIVAFNEPWKNVVATFYHELNEIRTDPDIDEAIRTGDDRYLGWTSNQGNEIGDYPIEASGEKLELAFREIDLANGKGKVPVQLLYSNADRGPSGPREYPVSPIATVSADLLDDVVREIDAHPWAPATAEAGKPKPSLARFSPPALLGDIGKASDLEGWSDVISGFFDKGKRELRKDLHGKIPQFYNPTKDAPPDADRAELPVLWQGFPKTLERKFAGNPEAAWQAAEEIKDGYVARTATQDEYLEWHVHRDGKTGKITRVDFTCEGPEYWEFLAATDPDLVFNLYRKHISPAVLKSDLFPNGKYEALNRWNQTEGAMHLTQGANSLFAEVILAAQATLLRMDQSGKPVTDANDLIICSKYGEPLRASDPHIGDLVNGLARQGYAITLKDPVGLYIHELDVRDWKKPDGLPVGNYFRLERGGKDFTVRATYEVPDGELANGKPFTVGDITIGGEPIRYGGQIAKRITMRLTGVALAKGGIRNPAFPCVSISAQALHVAPAIATRRLNRERH